MAERTLAQMTESELRQVIEAELKQLKTPANRARIKAGEIEVEFEGSEDFVLKSVNRFLKSLAPAPKFNAEPSEEYDFEKDKTVAIAPGPVDFGERISVRVESQEG